jgi:hypothetical protein
MRVIRDNLEHVDRVNNYDEVSDEIEKEITRMNGEYVTSIAEWLNTRRWQR